MKKDPYFFLILAMIAIWFLFGHPGDTIARLFFMHSSAPWERVDGIFYPDRHNIKAFQKRENIPSLIECRRWAMRAASHSNDPNLRKSDYRCGIGTGDENGYRLLID